VREGGRLGGNQLESQGIQSILNLGELDLHLAHLALQVGDGLEGVGGSEGIGIVCGEQGGTLGRSRRKGGQCRSLGQFVASGLRARLWW